MVRLVADAHAGKISIGSGKARVRNGSQIGQSLAAVSRTITLRSNYTAHELDLCFSRSDRDGPSLTLKPRFRERGFFYHDQVHGTGLAQRDRRPSCLFATAHFDGPREMKSPPGNTHRGGPTNDISPCARLGCGRRDAGQMRALEKGS